MFIQVHTSNYNYYCYDGQCIVNLGGEWGSATAEYVAADVDVAACERNTAFIRYLQHQQLIDEHAKRETIHL